MNSEYCTSEKELLELNQRCELLQLSRNETILFRNEYIRRNESNEKKLQRLLGQKEQLVSVREMLLKDYLKNSINAGQKKILLSHRIEEFQKKNETAKLKLQNLPSISQMHESVEFNKKLSLEHLALNEMLRTVKTDYLKIFCIVKNGFMEKVIEFSSEFLSNGNM